MITPKDIEELDLEEYDLDEIEKDIDRSIKHYHGYYPWEEAVLTTEYPLSVRNVIAKKYHEGGWKFVYHMTSSENNEESGLTSFIFSMCELDEEYAKNRHCIS